MNGSRNKCFVGLIALTVLAAVAVQAGSAAIDPLDLAHARTIRSETTARYLGSRGRELAVTESSSTGVLESYTLLSADLMEERIVPADNGVYYAICPRRATCPYPARRFARPAADFLPRRLALELALRTFLETSADVVAVSLPTPRFINFIVQRDDLVGEVDMPALAKALNGDPARTLAASLHRTVDQLTRPHVFVAVELVPTPNGRESLMGIARWRP